MFLKVSLAHPCLHSLCSSIAFLAPSGYSSPLGQALPRVGICGLFIPLLVPMYPTQQNLNSSVCKQLVPSSNTNVYLFRSFKEIYSPKPSLPQLNPLCTLPSFSFIKMPPGASQIVPHQWGNEVWAIGGSTSTLSLVKEETTLLGLSLT